MEAGLLLTRSIDIDLGGHHRVVVTTGGQPPEARLKRGDVSVPSEGSGGQNTPSNYPRGILTPERSRVLRRHGESLKAVSFNPRTECLLLEDI